MSIICVTGTNTDVGKTIATAALARHFQNEGFNVIPVKPVQTGEPEGHGDAQTIYQLTGIEGHTFACYPEPLAPNLSARRAGIEALSVEELSQKISALDAPDTVVLVEGAGGLLVRLNESESFADLVQALDSPLIVVASMGLGSLNLAELTVEACRRRAIHVAGMIGGSLPENPDLATRLNIEEMPRLCACPLWAGLPEGAGALEPAAFANMVDTLQLPPAAEILGRRSSE
ncbi:dethiobiotin synthase [Corynebacterium gerontici]|uniref:ATP-dependent dethiobiotin synthetase BioD n=1 Tax=Corynebacterium gerontici TaxID=2079234 RepID=A0A3G6J0B8_9CORY|nr:dethiobiotin synthase [Corynebacterium gerontici]AZA11366.1 ATP-dependent dethiobiotin synthetase BioD [Corynebacterium gerontici]